VLKPKRVLHIIPGYGGGISSTVRNLVSSIDSSKVQIDVVGFTTYSDDFYREITAKGGRVFTLRNVRIKTLYKCVIEYQKLLLKHGPYDVIHIHMYGYKAMYFSLISRLCGVNRIIVHAHIAASRGSDFWYNKPKMNISRLITRLAADQYVSCSRIATAYVFGGGALKRSKVMHIPNSVNVEKFAQNISTSEVKTIKQELDITDVDLVIGHIGQFGYQKNHDFMVKIIKRMKERNISFKWLFIGVGNERTRIEQDINNNQCEDVTLFLGRREDVHKLLQVMSVTVLPSHFEGLPTVTVETQVAGIPTVISTNVTNEVDMGIGLVKVLDLKESLDTWIDAILEMSKVRYLDRTKLINMIHQRGFTTEAASKLYECYIWNEIKNYNLGDELDRELLSIY